MKPMVLHAFGYWIARTIPSRCELTTLVNDLATFANLPRDFPEAPAEEWRGAAKEIRDMLTGLEGKGGDALLACVGVLAPELVERATTARADAIAAARAILPQIEDPAHGGPRLMTEILPLDAIREATRDALREAAAFGMPPHTRIVLVVERPDGTFGLNVLDRARFVRGLESGRGHPEHGAEIRRLMASIQARPVEVPVLLQLGEQKTRLLWMGVVPGAQLDLFSPVEARPS